MSTAIYVSLVLLALLAVLWRRLSVSIGPLVDAVVETKDLSALRQHIAGMRESMRPTAYSHAIKRLWDGFERPLAVELIRDLAEQFPDANIAQYWVRETLQTEKGLANRAFSEKFLQRCYRPEVAAQCGPVG